MQTKYVKVKVREYTPDKDTIPKQYVQLIEMAKQATALSYAPYSEFHVGAAVLLANGQIIQGSNQENAAYPSGMCAERVAMFFANSSFPGEAVKAVAIAAMHNGHFTPSPISPCGACRQVIAETESRFGQAIEVLLIGNNKVQIIGSSHALLPLSFDSNLLDS